MEMDEPLCLCFHVSKRKVINFIRIEKPKRAAQLSQCFGAGTGCGWCRPFLQSIFDANCNPSAIAQLPSPEQYAAQRSQYIKEGGGTPPPGASSADQTNE